ncbi:copper homeostasis protein cutC homolog [Anopheles bellator]|uniref:copper homeostasis protein cutC homolog n=1 Tax=Anopheles bellator TaxID=139047 RepID=UPI0026491B73|nr:copper homeostasis protein cutC homolog [Anopheles bellator]
MDLSSSEILLEICVDSIESAIAAVLGGTNRIELCAALSEGGLTPTVGLLREVKRFIAGTPRKVPVYTMIRCRRGSDFRYDDHEMSIMTTDLEMLGANGADGFVFGALDEFGNVHRKHCEQMVAAAHRTSKTIPITFHRAIDCTPVDKLSDNLQLIAELGFNTVLTSGLKPTAMQGVNTIARMKSIVDEINKRFRRQLLIMPGSGVSKDNVVTLLKLTDCRAVHGSASIEKSPVETSGTLGEKNVDSSPLRVCSKSIVEDLRRLIDDEFRHDNTQ